MGCKSCGGGKSSSKTFRRPLKGFNYKSKEVIEEEEQRKLEGFDYEEEERLKDVLNESDNVLLLKALVLEDNKEIAIDALSKIQEVDDLKEVIKEVKLFVNEINPKFISILKYKFSKPEYMKVANHQFKF